MKPFSKSIIIFILSFIFFINISTPASAATFTPQIGIGEFKSGVPVIVEGNTIGKYILAIYNYAIGVIGIIAVIVMMIGGVIWISAAGSPERVGEAKSYIGASIFGLVLLLSSYTILNTINPNLTKFKSINPKSTDPVLAKEGDQNKCAELKGTIIFLEASENLTSRCNDPAFCGEKGGTSNLSFKITDYKADYGSPYCCICNDLNTKKQCGADNLGTCKAKSLNAQQYSCTSLLPPTGYSRYNPQDCDEGYCCVIKN